MSNLKRKKAKVSTKEELIGLSKEELVARILQLEAHNVQLKNIISKGTMSDDSEEPLKKQKKFDFSKSHKRHIFLRILYFGWNYQGLATQEDTTNTVEHHLFQALTKSCLVESRETSNYHRCGRTDKGVSAFGQVISLTVRSKFPDDQQDLPENVSSEMNYCKILNRLLPEDIRAVAWLPMPKEANLSARFNCKRRVYKYYFPKGDLDVGSMSVACAHLVGSHDFRNLCKMDVGNGVTEFIRNIYYADICPVNPEKLDDPYAMYYLQIEGNAFLWHQIRCIMAVLLLIGQGHEKPDVMKELLDVEATPRKPQYGLAMDVPLNLFKCEYDISDQWRVDKDSLGEVITHLQHMWTLASVKSTMMRDCLDDLENEFNQLKKRDSNGDEKTDEVTISANHKEFKNRIICQADPLIQGVKPKVYVPLLIRESCSSLEEKMEHYKKKGKLGNLSGENIE